MAGIKIRSFSKKIINYLSDNSGFYHIFVLMLLVNIPRLILESVWIIKTAKSQIIILGIKNEFEWRKYKAGDME
ncbi:uncharacterized protein METZ01_LOCUS177828 [marine metagenome]|uniref:Uncharacterized protein n=1 Tax=marine metagenome TaxID=408172 RepID=A0A382CGH2_9ZZZZ|nr:hypothetical protein [Deltaproteobacteria bacterium]